MPCWREGGFREVLNRLIEFDTKLAWHDADTSHTGPVLVDKDDAFMQWLREHTAAHGDPSMTREAYWQDFSADERFPDKRPL